MRELDRPAQELAEQGRPRPYPVPQPHSEFEPAHATVSPAHYLLVVWRQKGKIAAFVATCVLAAYLVSSRLTPIYEATAKIDVDRRIPNGVIGQEAAQGQTGDDGDAFMATQMELIQSDAVLRPVAERFKLLEKESQLEKLGEESARRKADAPVFLKYLKITRPISTYLLDISYRSTDPHLAANVANAIAQSFLQHTFEIRVKASGALSEFMEKQLEELKRRWSARAWHWSSSSATWMSSTRRRKPIFFLRGCCSSIPNTRTRKAIACARKPPIMPRAAKPWRRRWFPRKVKNWVSCRTG
jgi:capsular polysaccharide biosynthesis protein